MDVTNAQAPGNSGEQRLGDERAETYLRLLAEKELRQVLRAPADSTGTVVYSSSGHGNWADRRPSGTNPAANAEWTVDRAGRILIAAGALDEEFVHEVGSEIMAACTVAMADT